MKLKSKIKRLSVSYLAGGSHHFIVVGCWKSTSAYIGEINTGETNAGGQIFNGAHSQGHLLATTLCPQVVNPIGAHMCR